MSRLLKGESVLLDADGYVYISPIQAMPRPAAQVEVAPDPQQVLRECILKERMELEAAAQKARTIVDGANRYLVKAHSQARKQAEEMYGSAREEGFRQGYEEGFSKALAENEEALHGIVSLMDRIDRDREAILKEHEQAMADLALDVARKVVGAHLTKDDQAFLNIFKNATETLRGQKNVRLIISQHEAGFVTASSEYLLSLLHGAENLDIQVLENAPPGTCILETDDLLVEASAQGQLDKLTKAVEAAR